MDELLSPFINTVWGRRAAWSALLTMLMLLTVTCFTTLFSWRSDIKLIHPATSDQPAFHADNALAQRIADIPEWHLFGKAGSAFLPITSLQIRLVGVINAIPSTMSKVIISEFNQPAKVYQVGDTLPSSNVKIYAITEEGVILENDGHLEKLPLQRTPLRFQGMPKSLSGE